MAPTKVLFLVLAAVGSCAALPKLSRKMNHLEEEKTEAELQTQDTDVEFIDNPQPKTEIPQIASESSQSRKHDNSLRNVLRSQIMKGKSYPEQFEEMKEKGQQLIPIQLASPIKSHLGFEEVIYIPDSQDTHVDLKSLDRYEKLLESFIKGIISRVLQAKFKEVRIEEMERGHLKES